MSLKIKILVFALLAGGVLGGLVYGLHRFCDFCADAREAEVRNEWNQEKLDLIAARQAAERDAAEARKQAEGIKQKNQQRGEQVIEQTRNIDADWSNTLLPPGLFETLRKN